MPALRQGMRHGLGKNRKDAVGAGGSYARRGQEGSVTDRHSGLAHLQATDHHRTLGRMLQQNFPG